MKKVVLVFPSQADMAEFILACRLVHVTTDAAQCRLTGELSSACLTIAQNVYGAQVDAAPDFDAAG